ncbi:hypothetical protein JCM3774_000852 [Rhodotorula dairenensis]
MKLAAGIVGSLLTCAQVVLATTSDNLEKRRLDLDLQVRQYDAAYGAGYAGAAPAVVSPASSSAYSSPAMPPMGSSPSMAHSADPASMTGPYIMPCAGMSSGKGMAGVPSGVGYGAGSVPATSGAASNNSLGLMPGPGQVVVAPKQGDLRFVPFNINAKPGQNISFVWGAGPHTVTQSSALSICNATQEAGAFKSGMQNAGFEFSVPVKDESTIYYFCGVPTHCQKGMFGLINGAVADHPSDSFGNFLDQWGAMNSANQVLINITIQITASVPATANWGASLSMSQLEPWAIDWAMQQTLYTRQFFAQNPQLLAPDVNGTTPSSSSSGPVSLTPGSGAVPTGSSSSSSSSSSVATRAISTATGTLSGLAAAVLFLLA